MDPTLPFPRFDPDELSPARLPGPTGIPQLVGRMFPNMAQQFDATSRIMAERRAAGDLTGVSRQAISNVPRMLGAFAGDVFNPPVNLMAEGMKRVLGFGGPAAADPNADLPAAGAQENGPHPYMPQMQAPAPQRTIRVIRGSTTGPMTETEYGRTADGGYRRLPTPGEVLQARVLEAQMRPRPTPAKDVAGLGYLDVLNKRLTRQIGQANKDPDRLLAAENAYILDLQKWLAAAGIAPGAIFGNNVE